MARNSEWLSSLVEPDVHWVLIGSASDSRIRSPSLKFEAWTTSLARKSRKRSPPGK